MEVVNKCLETYLRCFAFDRQHQWVQWLPLAEWWYNTSYHTATHMTPFEAVYGHKPPLILPYMLGVSKVQEVDHNLTVLHEHSPYSQRKFGNGSKSHEATGRSGSF
jgi:hypothetical protein